MQTASTQSRCCIYQLEEWSAMKKWLPVLCFLASIAMPAQQDSVTAELPGKPFYLKQAWTIGGEGNWDYMAMDSAALKLYVAHGTAVQVVDVSTGTLAGEISGMAEAHGIALDDTGEFGYVSDGPASQVKVFDRQSLNVIASLPTGPNPRAIVFEPQNQLVLAISSNPQPLNPNPANPSPAKPNPANLNPARTGARGSNRGDIKSAVTVIDVQHRAVIATILLPGRLGFAQVGGRGRVYINLPDHNQIVSIDAGQIQSAIREAKPEAKPDAKPSSARPGVLLDWSKLPRTTGSPSDRLRFLPAGPECRDPRGLAVDPDNLRLFVACGNMRMAVVNANTGDEVAYLPIGPGTDSIGYDAARNLIYTANGGAQGTVTIIRQSVTDTYAVIQNLPTRRRARTLAVNSATGDVYLVTDVRGVSVDQAGGIGTLRGAPIPGSFQVLVIGN
jgi:DNA-binding beta-propeller fold protein YncE